MLHLHQTPSAHSLDDLGVEELWPWHPAGLGGWPFVLATRRLHPVAIVGEQGRQILPKAIGHKERRTVGRQHLRDVVDHALRHGQCTMPDVERQQEFALGVHGDPDPLGRTLQACDGVGRADRAILHRAEQGKEFVQLHLPDPYVA